MRSTIRAAVSRAFDVLPRDVDLQIRFWRNPSRYRHFHEPAEFNSLSGYDALNCVFVHVPKAAGTSVSKVLFGNHGFGHKSVVDYKRILGPLEYRRRFSFAFVRDPYTRLVSAYTFLKQGGMTERNRRFSEDRLSEVSSFAEFVTDWLTPETMWEAQHFQPQSHFVCDRGRIGVDFVGRFEALERDFAQVCVRLGIARMLPHSNRTDRSAPLLSYYTPDLRRRVASLYAEDFDLLGYSISQRP